MKLDLEKFATLRFIETYKNHAILVCDDQDPPTENDSDMPEVLEDLTRCFLAGDYFSIYLIDGDSDIVDSLHSVAGYGSTQAAIAEYKTCYCPVDLG